MRVKYLSVGGVGILIVLILGALFFLSMFSLGKIDRDKKEQKDILEQQTQGESRGGQLIESKLQGSEQSLIPPSEVSEDVISEPIQERSQITHTLVDDLEAREQIPVTPSTNSYPLHTDITAAVFWVGEPVGNGSSEDNALSAWDDEWQRNYGGYDDPQNRNGYYPAGFIPKENPFYLDLPYNDFNNNGKRKANASQIVPWASEKTWGSRESMMKNRWVKITHKNTVCYGQIQDAGPYEYDDHPYVFGVQDERPKSKIANNAGMDVSPALRDCLKFDGWNNVSNKVSWQFIPFAEVPAGPWKEIVTTSQVNWD